MKYNVHLSNQLNQDIFIDLNGNIWLQYKSNNHLVGTTADHVVDIRKNVEKFL